MYPEHLVAPMRQELVEAGFEELRTPEEVEAFLDREGVLFIVINSVCGCAAASARPAAIMALAQSPYKPDHIATVFAGVDIEATKKVREYLLPYPPSSPSMALLKNRQLLHMIERHEIEGVPAEILAQRLTQLFEQYCKKD